MDRRWRYLAKARTKGEIQDYEGCASRDRYIVYLHRPCEFVQINERTSESLLTCKCNTYLGFPPTSRRSYLHTSRRY